MSRIDNVVFVSNGWKRGKTDIEDALNIRDTVHVHAQGDAIEIAISLAEHFVKKISSYRLTVRTRLLRKIQHQYSRKLAIWNHTKM